MIAATTAKNQLASVHGFSPIQHVLGQDIRVPGSLMNHPENISAHSLASQEGPFQKSLAMRETARRAWIRLDNSSRLRRALVAKNRREQYVFMPGMQAYFWRRRGSMKGKFAKDPERWVGPAIVLATEGSRAVWLSYRMSLLKVSPEHLRSATAEECMAQKFVLEQIEEMNHQMVEPRGQAKFFDLTELSGERPRRTQEHRGDEPTTPSHRDQEPIQEPST